MAGPIIEVLIVALLVVANGVFAMAEIAIVSARRERLQALVNEGRSGARAALALSRDPNRFLSTVQIGITLVGILAGAYGGATIAARLSDLVDGVPALARYSDAISVAIVVVVIAYLSLVIGELVPKRLGLRAPERIASSVARPMTLLAAVAAPVVGLLSVSTDLVLRLLRTPSSVEHAVTEDEIKLLMRQGLLAGSIEAGEQQMVSGVFRLHDRPVRAFMTPRQQIVWFDVNDSPARLSSKVRHGRYSQYPVCDGDLEDVVGMAVSKDLLAGCLSGEPVDVTALTSPVLFIPETSTGSDVLNLLLETESKAGIVIDESGGVEGMVTVDDILGEIVGEDAQEVVLQGNSWVVDGRVGLDLLRDAVQIHLPIPEEEADIYHTLGGFVMARLGRVPEEGDSFLWNGVLFTVRRMDGNRVSSVAMSREAEIEPRREPAG
jgi:putative hemolysin